MSLGVAIRGPQRRLAKWYRWVGVVPFQKASGHGCYLAEMETDCATCGKPWRFVTPLGMVEKYGDKQVPYSGSNFGTVNCPACRHANQVARARLEQEATC